jgi:general stress protein 26
MGVAKPRHATRSTSIIIMVLSAWLTSGCAAPPEIPANRSPSGSARESPDAELRMAADPTAVLDAARALMVADAVVALATVDDSGRPRVRSVRAFLDPVEPGSPSSGFTVWVLTRFTTRKVEQIRAHPDVTLYFNDDDASSYASIVGTALIHTDPGHPGAKRHYEGQDVRFYWPDFPRDFVMLEIRPQWLEFIGPGVSNDEQTWRPQAVIFD